MSSAELLVEVKREEVGVAGEIGNRVRVMYV